METITPPERSVVAGAGTAVCSAAIAGLTIALAADPALPLGASVGVATVGLLLAAAVAGGASRLIRARGGLFIDRARRRIGIGLTGLDDVWWLPLDRVTGARVSFTPRDEGVVWHVSLALTGGADLILLDCAERQEARDVAEAMSRGAEVPLLEDPPRPPAPSSGQASLSVHRRVALHGLLSLLGASLVVVGVALFFQFEQHPVFAILFAPLMGLLGASLLGVVVIKRYGREELVHRGGLWTHEWSMGSLRWGKRTIAAAHPTWCLRVKSARGAQLELIGEDDVILLATGATTLSSADVDALAALPARFIEAG